MSDLAGPAHVENYDNDNRQKNMIMEFTTVLDSYVLLAAEPLCNRGQAFL